MLIFVCFCYKSAALLSTQLLSRFRLWVDALNPKSPQIQSYMVGLVWICAYLGVGGRGAWTVLEWAYSFPPLPASVLWYHMLRLQEGKVSLLLPPAQLCAQISSGAWGDKTSLILRLDGAHSWGSQYPPQLLRAASNNRKVGASKKVLIDGFSIKKVNVFVNE